MCMPLCSDLQCKTNTDCGNVMGVDYIAEEESLNNRNRSNRVMPRSSYYDNFNSSIFGEQVRNLGAQTIPLQYLNTYEQNFDRDLTKQKLMEILIDLQRSISEDDSQWILKEKSDFYTVMIS